MSAKYLKGSVFADANSQDLTKLETNRVLTLMEIVTPSSFSDLLLCDILKKDLRFTSNFRPTLSTLLAKPLNLLNLASQCFPYTFEYLLG